MRRGLILYGNTRDLFHDAGARYSTLPQQLFRRLQGVTIRAAWDRVDGLRFASDGDARRWDRAAEQALGPTGGGEAYDVGDANGSTQEGAQRMPLLEVLAQYRLICRAGDERPALIIDWSHLLVTQPAHPDPEEREWLLQLGKALVGEPEQRVDSDSLTRGQGLLVLVSASLGAIPPALYQGEPRVRLINIPAPSRAERKAFFSLHADDVRVEVPREAPGAPVQPPRNAKIEALAELTDQLAIADLIQVVRLSRTINPPTRPDRLLNLYRFGDQRSPWEELSEEKLQRVRETLHRRVVGQDAAVDHVATMILRAWLGLAGLQHSARRSKPKGTLFFVGPTGVGKTELAKACAEFLFGDEGACIRFDMSEFNHEHSDQRLIGAPPGYVGFEEGGQLTNAVSARPFSVLLFDEVEKAHPRVLDKFLQILEDGRLTDGRGETAWFSETVIIFTSNIGAAEMPKGGSAADLRRHFHAAVETHFVRQLGRPELLNRLGDNVVVFAPVTGESNRMDILRRKLEPLRAHLLERWGVALEMDEPAERHLVGEARADHGGRGLLNAVERALVNPLADFLFERHHQLRKGRTLHVSLEEEHLKFELRGG
jgi:energy-coupling factor transporter ATP-binding protein EcfA2